MASCTDLDVRVIPPSIANKFVRAVHYSGKVATTTTLSLGVFLDGSLHGVMQFGAPIDKRKILHLVEGTGWNQMLELNRMAFDDVLPKNSESRALSVAMRLIRKNAPQIKWVLSFADGCQCGDGTIYRASNFVLTDIKPNEALVKLPSGEVVHRIALACRKTAPRKELGGRSFADACGCSWSEYVRQTGGEKIQGYMLRYIYFIDKRWRKRLTVPELPYSAITEAGAGMYKGERR